MKPYRAGALRQTVTLQNPAAESFDGFGQPVAAWTTVGTYSAQIRPLSGREAVVAKQEKAEASHMITMRWLGPDVVLNPLSRLTYTDPTLTAPTTRIFGVVQVVNVEERDRWYEVVVAEIQQTGQV